MEYASVQPELATLLRDRPLGTTADLNKYTVAYWDGHDVRGIHLHRDNSGRLGGDFDFDERTSNQLHAHILSRIYSAGSRGYVDGALISA
jgi:hypothetical protein